MGFSGQILLEIDQFCTDLMSTFNVSLTEIIICYFKNKVQEKWANGKAFNIMTSAQCFATYLRLVVLGRCLLIVVMKFQDKFASTITQPQ